MQIVIRHQSLHMSPAASDTVQQLLGSQLAPLEAYLRGWEREQQMSSQAASTTERWDADFTDSGLLLKHQTCTLTSLYTYTLILMV